MTARQRRNLQRYVDKVKPLLALSEWQVCVDEDSPPEGWLASCTPIEGRLFARLKFDADFFLLSEPEQRQTVIHELLHASLAHTRDIIRVDLLNVLEQDVHSAVYYPFIRAVEYELDHLATALAPLFPELKL